MESQDKKLAFISYRRDDSSAHARSIRDNLVAAFGDGCVFMDVEQIRMGASWPSMIETAIAHASVLLVVIGPKWLFLQDKYGRRRLDKEDDWVRNEIALSLERSIPIIPVRVSGASFPATEAFPKDIQELHKSQHFELRDEHWQSDTDALLLRLNELGFARLGQRYSFPIVSRDFLVPRALTEAELNAELQNLPGWKPVSSPLPGEHPNQRVEIVKAFHFNRFEDAIAFMYSAVPEINKLKHHPRWENVWKTVTIWSTTWDARHVLTYLDIELAKLIEDLYKHFPGKASGGNDKNSQAG